jgi:LCP family protein required for cell wall assembly
LRKPVLGLLALALAGMLAFLFLWDPWDWFRRPARVPGEAWEFKDPLASQKPGPLSQRPLHFLVMGIDHGQGRPPEGNQRSDVLMIVRFNERTGRIVLLSIPRDSYVNVPGYGKHKINEAYQLGGAKLAVKTVEEITGLSLDGYVALDFDGFVRLVDLFGGVEITLEKDLKDPKLGYIPKGRQVLDGSRALILARSRNYPRGDLARIEQQQRLVAAILRKGRERAGSPGIAWLLAAALENVETDLDLGRLLVLAGELAFQPALDLQACIAPGESGNLGGASIYRLDEEGLDRLLRSLQAADLVPEEFRTAAW